MPGDAAKPMTTLDEAREWATMLDGGPLTHTIEQRSLKVIRDLISMVETAQRELARLREELAETTRMPDRQ